MDFMTKIVRLFLIGFKDCLVGVCLLVTLRRRPGFTDLLKKLSYLVGLNGVALGLTAYGFDTFLLPFVHNVFTFTGIGGAWIYLKPFLSFTFNTLWILPLFTLSRLMNCVLYQNIADKTFEMACGRRRTQTTSLDIAEAVCSILVQTLFMVQGFAVSMFPIPVIADSITAVHTCLLYSLYAFDYKWTNKSVPLNKKLSVIEHNLPYFIGFGCPLALPTIMIESYIIRICAFSVMFPLYVVSSTICKTNEESFSYRPPIFTPSTYLSVLITNKICLYFSSKKPTGQK